MKELLNKNILLVDDEKEILKLLEESLFKEGFYHIFTAENCSRALKLASQRNIALFVLDVSLPDGNGFSLYEDIREFSDAPVIFLTARGEAEDRLRGLELGADDYIVKPFLTREFVLRVKGLLKRTYQTEPVQSGFDLPDRRVSFETASVICGDDEIRLTAKELILIKKLYENKNKIVTNDDLCLAAWGDDYYGYASTLMVHIRHIREKLELNPSKPSHIITVKGIGYKLVI